MSSMPYPAGGTENCTGPDRYIPEKTQLCCSRCLPGHKLRQECTATTDTVCEPCGPEQHMERMNFNKNCFSCLKCKDTKGLQYIQNCSSTTNAKCDCLPGRFCVMEYRGSCKECKLYRKCREGYGVLTPGTATTDVRCAQCPEGTFSDSISSTEACKPHSFCDERHIISKGNATSDTVCKSAASTQPSATLTTRREATAMPVTAAIESLNTTQMKSKPFPKNSFTTGSVLVSTKKDHVQQDNVPDKQLAGVIGSAAGVCLLLIVIALLVLCKRVPKKATLENCPKVDRNGNCETDNEIQTKLCYLKTEDPFSFIALQSEQQNLLENGYSNQNHCISNCNATSLYQESTLPALSEPLPLQSIDPAVSQIGTSLQSSSQPTSPQTMTPSPLVNVNINLHIGNGTCGTPAVMLKDIEQVEAKIPFGAEEESCCLLQQEDGKPSLLSVEESGGFSNMSLKTLDQFA